MTDENNVNNVNKQLSVTLYATCNILQQPSITYDSLLFTAKHQWQKYNIGTQYFRL